MSEEMPAAPTATREPRRRGAPGLTWAIILISVGAVALLNNLNIVTISWIDLLQFWPVILILVGLDVLVGRRSLFGSVATAAIAVLVIGGLVWFVGVVGTRLPNAGPTVSRNFSQALGDVDAVAVTLKLGAGETSVKALSGSQNVVDGTYTTNSNLKLDVAYTTSGKTGRLVVSQVGTQNRVNTLGNYVGQLNMNLTDAVPVDLTIEAGVGQVTLDLTGINLKSLTVKGGVGELNLILPDRGDYPVKVEVGVGSIDIRIPRSLAARVDYKGGISNISVPKRFDAAGKGQWQTSDFTSAANRASFQLDSGIGSVDITE